MHTSKVLFGFLFATLASGLLQAEQLFGFSSVPVRINSDNFIPAPYAKTPEFTGPLVNHPTVSGNTATLPLVLEATAPGAVLPQVWGEINAAQRYFYVRFTSGLLAGRYFSVTGTSDGNLLINTNGDTSITQAVAGDTVNVIPYWTLREFISPQALNPTPVDNFNLSSVELYIPDYQTPGFNLVPNRYFMAACPDGTNVETSNLAWVDMQDMWSTGDNMLLPPDGYLFLRLYDDANWNFPNGKTSLLVHGYCEPGPLLTQTDTLITGSQDNHFAIPLTKPTTVSQLQIGPSFVQSLNNIGPGRRDALYVYLPDVSGWNRAPALTLFKVNGQWRSAANLSVSADDLVLPAHSVFFIRKYKTLDGSTSFISYEPSR